MSLKRNTIANFVGQGYSILIGILMLPLYLQYLDPEAFGLVGFFTVLQGWLSLFDVGLSPTIARQIACVRGKSKNEIITFHRLLHTIELFFLVMSVSLVIIVWIASPWLSSNWLSVNNISLSIVGNCIAIMGIIIGMRFFASLYRSGIQGMEHQVWINTANIIIATMRFVLIYIILRWISRNPLDFFLFQLAVSVIEILIMSLKFYKIVPSIGERSEKIWGFYWSSIKPVLPFISGIAFTSFLWVLLTQTDKLILTHYLPLKEYGYFALSVVAANGILLLSSPISNSILPRMTLLLSQGKEEEMIALYHKSTQFVAVIIIPFSGVMALFSYYVLYVWTGNTEVALAAAPILTWFTLGNGILAVGAFQYYLQYAHGKIGLHAINTTINALVQIPIFIYAALEYGAFGAAFSWFIIRLVAFLIWPPIVHRVFAPGIHLQWMTKDIMPVFLTTSVILIFINIIISNISSHAFSRPWVFIGLLTVSLVIIFASAFSVKEVRQSMFNFIRSYFPFEHN
jgi:O-antigen/teichoic acid export membrane protein